MRGAAHTVRCIDQESEAKDPSLWARKPKIIDCSVLALITLFVLPKRNPTSGPDSEMHEAPHAPGHAGTARVNERVAGIAGVHTQSPRVDPRRVLIDRRFVYPARVPRPPDGGEADTTFVCSVGLHPPSPL